MGTNSRSQYLATTAIVTNDLNLLCAVCCSAEYVRDGWLGGWVILLTAIGLYVCGILMAKVGDRQSTSAHQVMLHYAESKLQELNKKIEAELEVQDRCRPDMEAFATGRRSSEDALLASGWMRTSTEQLLDTRLQLASAAAEAEDFCSDNKFILHHSRQQRCHSSLVQKFISDRCSRRNSLAPLEQTNAYSYLALFRASLAKADRVLQRTSTRKDNCGTDVPAAPSAASSAAASSAIASSAAAASVKVDHALLSQIVTTSAKEGTVRACYNHIDLVHALPMLRIARFGLPAQCAPIDVCGLLSVNALHAFTLGCAQMLLGTIYLHSQRGQRLAISVPSFDMHPIVEAAVALSSLSFVIALITHTLSLQTSVADAERADGDHRRFANDAKTYMDELVHVITERKEMHMNLVWKRFAAADFKPRLLLTGGNADCTWDRVRWHAATLFLLRGAGIQLIVVLNFFEPVIEPERPLGRLASLIEFSVGIVLASQAALAAVSYWRYQAALPLRRAEDFAVSHHLVSAWRRVLTFSLLMPLHLCVPAASISRESRLLYVEDSGASSLISTLTDLAAQLVLPALAAACALLKFSQVSGIMMLAWQHGDSNVWLRAFGVLLQISAFAGPQTATGRSLVSLTFSGDGSCARGYDREGRRQRMMSDSIGHGEEESLQPDPIPGQRQKISEHTRLVRYNICAYLLQRDAQGQLTVHDTRAGRVWASARAVAWCLTMRESDVRRSMLAEANVGVVKRVARQEEEETREVAALVVALASEDGTEAKSDEAQGLLQASRGQLRRRRPSHKDTDGFASSSLCQFPCRLPLATADVLGSHRDSHDKACMARGLLASADKDMVQCTRGTWCSTSDKDAPPSMRGKRGSVSDGTVQYSSRATTSWCENASLRIHGLTHKQHTLQVQDHLAQAPEDVCQMAAPTKELKPGCFRTPWSPNQEARIMAAKKALRSFSASGQAIDEIVPAQDAGLVVSRGRHMAGTSSIL